MGIGMTEGRKWQGAEDVWPVMEALREAEPADTERVEQAIVRYVEAVPARRMARGEEIRRERRWQRGRPCSRPRRVRTSNGQARLNASSRGAGVAGSNQGGGASRAGFHYTRGSAALPRAQRSASNSATSSRGNPRGRRAADI